MENGGNRIDFRRLLGGLKEIRQVKGFAREQNNNNSANNNKSSIIPFAL